MSTPDNLLTEWARLFVGALVRAGLEDLVVSPGARSTPVLVAAHRTEGLHVHVVRDERAAAFFALGRVRATGRPAGLLCTSGSAPGHYLPAVMEARADRLPLVIVTADRPPELHGIAAPQTVDQTRLFGAHGVGYVDLGIPDAHPAALDGLVRKAAQALDVARYPEPGAVQVNFRARKPLEPQGAEGADAAALTAAVGARLEVPMPRAYRAAAGPNPEGVAALVADLASARRPLIVAGPRALLPEAGAEQACVDAVFALAARLGAPLLAEASSQLRLRPCPAGVTRVDGYDRILLAPQARADLAPDVVVQVGGPPTSAPLLRAYAEWSARRWILDTAGWSDVDNRARGIVTGPLTAALRSVEAAVSPAPASFAPRWRDADGLAWGLLEPLPWGEGAAARAAIAATPAEAGVMLGNSLSIRHVEAFVAEHAHETPVVVQRGLNGIDGLVAGAVGWASARGQGLTLLLGDVSLLHDVTSLELARGLDVPLVVVVIDNHGGRIFERLPMARTAPDVMPAFVTEPEVDIEGLAEALGAFVRRAQDAHEVGAAVAKGHRRPGVTVVRAVVPEHEAQDALRALTDGMRRAWKDRSDHD